MAKHRLHLYLHAVTAASLAWRQQIICGMANVVIQELSCTVTPRLQYDRVAMDESGPGAQAPTWRRQQPWKACLIRNNDLSR